MYTIFAKSSRPFPLSDSKADAPDEGGSQAVKVQLKLREMIFSGELQAGARLTELAMVERLGVSRTPIRAALIRLEQEGLLQPWPSGGSRRRVRHSG